MFRKDWCSRSPSDGAGERQVRQGAARGNRDPDEAKTMKAETIPVALAQDYPTKPVRVIDPFGVVVAAMKLTRSSRPLPACTNRPRSAGHQSSTNR